MTTVTRKIRRYMVLFEDMVVAGYSDTDPTTRERAQFNLTGFARMINGEREAMRRLGALLEQQTNIEMGIRTVREDFPHLFEDKKVSMK